MTDQGRPLRLVCFSPSLIADIDNPAVTSTRALLAALARAGHVVTHLERRGNALLDRQLRSRGSAALRAVNARYPDVRVRLHDLPPGKQQRVVWFGTEVSTADAVIAFPGTPDDILDLIARFETPYLVRVVPVDAEGDLIVGSTQIVEPRPPADERSDIIVVAYDDIDDVWRDTVPVDLVRLVVGATDPPGWTYLPEVEVAERYRSTQVALVLGAGDHPEALSRLLLPLAAGCSSVAPLPAPGTLHTALRYVDPPNVATALRDPHLSNPPGLPAEHDASRAAVSLVGTVREALARKRREFHAGPPGRG